MTIWVNSDGLAVKFPSDMGDVTKGGAIVQDGYHITELLIDYTDALSATSAILGSALAATDGSFGVSIPKGARIEEIETVVQTAFMSSGTIGSATLELGLKKSSDRSTELDHDGFLTTSATGTVLGLATVGSKIVTRVGSTGAGALLGTSISENGIVTLRNSAHGSHPFTAGKLLVRIMYLFVV